MAITTASQSQIGQDTAKNSQVVTTVIKNFNSGTLGSGPSITSVVVTDSSYNTLDDTAVTTSNGYIKIIGTGFTSTANVYIGSSAVPAANVTFVSSTEIRARVPVLSVGNYSLSLFNSNSSGTISSSTFIVSTGPAWSTGATLSNQTSGTSFGVSLSATSDTSVTYANTTALPAGTTLAANGYFSGTVTIGSQTTYTFDVKATDVENQDATRTFSLTVTVILQGSLYGFGQNSNGTLGLNDQISRSSPTQVGAGTNWSDVKQSLYHSLALKSDGTLWSWGQGGFGELGLGDTNARLSPTQIGSLTNWSKISAGTTFSLSIKMDGTLWGWGVPNHIGSNTDENNGGQRRLSPVQIGTDTTWSKINSQNGSTFAIKTNGTLWTWGANQNGVLGLNVSQNYFSSPTQVGAGTDWLIAKSGGSNDAHGLKTNGTLWTWGFNDYGQLGLNDTVKRSSPVQVGTNTNWSSVDVGGLAAAVKTDGTLWNWGFFNANNDTIYKSSPTQVGTGTNWSTVLNARNALVAVTKTDGTLWVWGLGNQGMLGFNNTVNKSSPVQLGTGTNWIAVDVEQLTTVAIG